MNIQRVVAMVVLAGCASSGGEDEQLGSTEAAVVNPAAPYVGPHTLAATLPPLGAHGRVAENPGVTLTGADTPHDVEFTDGVDLDSSPIEDRSSTTDIFDAWAAALAGVDNAGYVQPPAFAPRVRAALDRANARMGSLSADVLKDAAQVFAAIPGFSDPTPADPIRDFAAWQAPRARWLDSQWARGPSVITFPPHPLPPETHFHYPTPSALSLMPNRGARLYCAAEQMALHQPTAPGSLGKKVLIPISILGQDIDIGVFRPFAYVDNPEKDLGGSGPPNDGAQAFNIPFQLGVQISPLEPFLPPLPEIRYPLVLTAADGVVVNDSKPAIVYVDRRCFTSWLCFPVLREEFRQRHATVAHVDSALTVGQSMKTSALFPLFWAGPLFVQLSIDFGAAVGTTVPPFGHEAGTTVVTPVSNDRLLSMTFPPAGWPAQIREGTSSGPYLDGFWNIPQSYFNPDSGSQFYDVHDGSTIAGTAVTTPQDPFRTRVLEDDDHHITPTSELAILGGLKGTLGYSSDFATLAVTAKGEFKVTAGLAHDIRHAVSADHGVFGSSIEPLESLTITPESYATAALHFEVNFALYISLFIGHISVDYDIINKDIPITSDLSPWSEEHRVRLGTASTVATPPTLDVSEQPSITSHVGPGLPFPSFPTTVSQCLADPPVSVPVPPTCKPTPATGTPAHIEACITLAISPQIDPCLNIPSGSNLDPATQCLHDKLTYFCGPVAKEQLFKGEYLLAHRLSLPTAPDGTVGLSSTELTAMTTMTRSCEALAAPADPDTWFKSQFKIVACDATATLLDSDTLIVSRGDTGVEAGGSCP